MILACNNINKAFLEQDILKDASFHINERERVALVGINGAGKTTLLRILVGEMDADSGEVIRAKDTTLGYLPQQQEYHSSQTIYEELLAVKSDVIEMDKRLRVLEQDMVKAEGNELKKIMEQYNRLQTAFESGEGYSYKSKVVGVINGLGFGGDAMNQCIDTLSGGQKTRVALGRLLLMEPDLLVLDEPTNHLDLESIQWLESYLGGYRGSVLIVSHDRYFLDRIAEKVVEIEHGKVMTFNGNYSMYAKKKEALRETLLHQYYNQQQEIRHHEAVIEKLKSFNREKSIRRAESREKMLAKIERLDKPQEYEKKMSFTLTPYQTSGNDVLKVEDFKKSFGDNELFEHISFEIKRGEKIAILGQNGTGKTTLLKMICGLEPADTGTATLGTHVEIGYYDQEHNILHEKKTIFEEIQDDYPYLDNTEIRNVLAAFLFTGDDVFKQIGQLSGGEKGRVSLAKLMLSEANFLLLDEPTNHLDIASREILEDAVNNYTGTVLYVSHDRYFINRTATRILDLTEKKLLSYPGNYTYYLEKKETMERIHLDTAPDTAQAKGVSQGKLNWKAQKEQETKKRKLQSAYQKEEDFIEELENRIAAIDGEMLLPENATSVEQLTKLSEERDEKETALTSAMERWEQLAQELEALNVKEGG